MTGSIQKQTGSDVSTTQPPRGLNVFDEMERMFESFSPSGWTRPFRSNSPLINEMSTEFATNIPKVDVIDRDGEIIVKAMMPGVEKKDIEISMTKNTVTISGKTSHEDKEEKGDFYRCEISKGSYMRTLSLPENVDEDKAKAKFKDGMLELTIPKVEVSHRRTIKVD